MVYFGDFTHPIGGYKDNSLVAREAGDLFCQVARFVLFSWQLLLYQIF